MKTYNNFEQLKKEQPNAAKELIDYIGKGQWQKEILYFCETEKNFAEYELTEGWYADMEFNRDYNGAPNPFDYIDLQSLAEALQDDWDESCYCNTGYGIVSTSYGW